MKQYKIKYSKLAISDLERMKQEVYLASEDYLVTEKYVDDMFDKIENLTKRPETGIPLIYEDIPTGYYFVVHKLYYAFYRFEGDCILVDRVLYGKSDYIRTLGL